MAVLRGCLPVVFQELLDLVVAAPGAELERALAEAGRPDLVLATICHALTTDADTRPSAQDLEAEWDTAFPYTKIA